VRFGANHTLLGSLTLCVSLFPVVAHAAPPIAPDETRGEEQPVLEPSDSSLPEETPPSVPPVEPTPVPPPRAVAPQTPKVSAEPGPLRLRRRPPVPATEQPTLPAAVAPSERSVTATRVASVGIAQAREQTPANVTVVTRDEMSKRGWRSVADVLTHVPGFYVTDDGSLTSVAARGVNAGLNTGTRLVKVLINGVAVNYRPEQRAFLGPEYLPIEAIDRIEIALGPLSSVWGANALLATVNVVTLAPRQGASATLSGGVALLRGNRPGYGGSGVASYADDNVELVLAVSSYLFDESGVRVQRTFASQDPMLTRYAAIFAGPSRNDYSSPASVFLQLSLPSEQVGTLSLNAGFQQLDAGAEFRQSSVLTHQSRESLRNAWAGLRHQQRWVPAFSSMFDVGFAAGGPTRDDRLYLTGTPSQSFTRNFAYRELSSRLVLEFAPSDRFAVRVGFDAQVDFEDIQFYTVTFAADQGNRAAGESVDLIDANVVKTQTLANRGAFLEVGVSPIPALPNLSLTGTARVDRVSYGSSAPPMVVSGRAAAAYRILPGLVTKLLYGRGFHAPSGVLLFAESGFGISNNLIGNLSPTSGAPRLELETVSGVEGVVSLAIAEHAYLEAAAFTQQIDDKIEYVNVGADYVARNAGDQAVRGAELAARGVIGPVSPSLTGAWVAPGGDEVLTAYPKFVGSAGLRVTLFEQPQLVFDGRVRHVSSRLATASNRALNAGRAYSLPGYQSVDLALSVSGLRWFGPRSDTGLLASLRNLLDERHSEPGFGGFDLPAPGRTSYFELRQSF
jgi:iron complex outermembrane receptor protein